MKTLKLKKKIVRDDLALSDAIIAVLTRASVLGVAPERSSAKTCATSRPPSSSPGAAAAVVQDAARTFYGMDATAIVFEHAPNLLLQKPLDPEGIRPLIARRVLGDATFGSSTG